MTNAETFIILRRRPPDVRIIDLLKILFLVEEPAVENTLEETMCKHSKNKSEFNLLPKQWLHLLIWICETQS